MLPNTEIYTHVSNQIFSKINLVICIIFCFFEFNDLDMKYDIENRLTETEINSLNDDELFEYLDSRVEFYKKISRPLDTYHTKQFLAATKGGEISSEELKRAKEIGSVGDEIKSQNISDSMDKLGGDPKLRDSQIKNIKTNRSQWFE